jgi:2,4-dienoyl-CoA reductase-like NADH-dependent reductase (Old Yellow Enzyme family)/thioredoxin reductase
MERKSGKSLKYPKIFSPGRIGTLELENRLIKSPCHVKLGGRDGSVTDRLIEHYRKQASGGVGLVMVEYAYVDQKASKSGICQISIADNEYIPGLMRLAQVIKDSGAKAALQITHCGRQKFLPYLPAKAPSRIPWEELHAKGARPPEELTFEEIQEIVKAFGDAALRVKLAGFDMLEIHGANGYLITNFLSSRTNRRNDWYGGSLQNRMRFLLEIVSDIRQKIGPGFPFSVRLSGSEYEPDGVTIEETIEVGKALEKNGVDAIHVCGGNHHTTHHTISPMFIPRGNNVWAAEALKKVVKIPIIANGSLNTAELIEEVVASEKADFVALGRPLYADPSLPNKMLEGKPEDIAPCIRCNEGCVERSRKTFQSVQCTVNPSLGMEDMRKIVRAAKGRKVVIVGGGPAGMEAAIVSALRGHKVTLFEKRKLGGALVEASIPDFKTDIRNLISYFSTQIEKLGIEVRHQEATPRGIAEGGFDAAIIAIGSNFARLDVRGIDNPIVSDALAVLRGEVKLGNTIIVVGAGYVGLELALYLAEQKRQVTSIECRDEYYSDFERGTLNAMLERFGKCNFTVHTGRLLDSVLDKGAVITDRFGKKEEIPGDNVILATGFEPQTGFLEKISSISQMPLFAVGDCVKPRKIFEAIHEGYMAGVSV